MAPIRRYLRITKFSVLEVRIYLHNPSDAGWLLSSRDNVLQRIIAEVRPKVLPKLREENENAKGRKGGVRKKKKGGIKDVASQEDFEVAIFLKETATRHSLLTKQKVLGEGKSRLQSTGSKLTGGLNAANPIHVTDEPNADVRQEEEDEDVVELYKIPELGGKRKANAEEDGNANGKEDEDEDGLFVSSSDEDFFATQRAKPPTKKRRKCNTDADEEKDEEDVAIPVDEEEQDDKKKLMMDTTYDGFSIYGRILCLIVTRKGKRDKGPQGTGTVGGGSQMMEQWVSTQVAGEMGIEDEEG
ncbi:hypothetical protein TI39_contig4312g00009 [Zymoseptoria brevis]|uniref:Uncharacterized protein n=1 Tax=Zymoseptoria brevis TaxID=1047168 RepID=A0A0F4G8Z5_9PEZI|nr:hypothetical protein TI39_contig4312g00009 [Zymoseptoria brevis]